MSALLHGDVTQAVIKAFYHVYNSLGYGFLEKVYENAMVYALRKAGLEVEPQVPINVFFEGVAVGTYYVDLLIENRVIVELKAIDALCDANEAQLLNYLKATTIEVGLLLNFGPKPERRRKVFTNDRKGVSSNSPRQVLPDDDPF